MLSVPCGAILRCRPPVSGLQVAWGWPSDLPDSRGVRSCAPTPLKASMACLRKPRAQPGRPFAARCRDLVRVIPRAAEAPFLASHEAERARLALGPLCDRQADAGERRDMAEGERACAPLSDLKGDHGQDGMFPGREPSGEFGGQVAGRSPAPA